MPDSDWRFALCWFHQSEEGAWEVSYVRMRPHVSEGNFYWIGSPADATLFTTVEAAELAAAGLTSHSLHIVAVKDGSATF